MFFLLLSHLYSFGNPDSHVSFYTFFFDFGAIRITRYRVYPIW